MIEHLIDYSQMQLFDWVDSVLSTVTITPVAYIFNIYENQDKTFSTELTGSNSFSNESSESASGKIFSSEKFIFRASDWKQALEFIKKNLLNYLANGNKSQTLKNSQSVACGFVDGDLHFLYLNKPKQLSATQKPPLVTWEKIKNMPSFQLYAWMSAYADYTSTKFATIMESYRLNKTIPSNQDESEMREFLYNYILKNPDVLEK